MSARAWVDLDRRVLWMSNSGGARGGIIKRGGRRMAGLDGRVVVLVIEEEWV